MTLLYRDISNLSAIEPAFCAALGKFEGMHIGHQKILKRLGDISKEKSLPSVLISFYPNPNKIFHPERNYPGIATLRQRVEILREFGVDYLLLLRFSLKFSKVTAEDFINKDILSSLNVKHLLIGEDARVGHKRLGTPEVIRELMSQAGSECETISFADYLGEKVASGWVREVIAAGDFKSFRKLTGRNYIVDSRIVKGDGRGHDLGFPTANLKKNNQVLPLAGIYVTKATMDGKTYPSVTSVGYRPTFSGKDKIVEVHIIDFPDTNIYGKRMSLEFIDFLRAEVKYDNIPDLVRQIKLDVENARNCLKEYG